MDSELVQGVRRIPQIDPLVLKNIISDKFPDINNWFIQFAEVVVTLLDIADHKLIGQNDSGSCQRKNLTEVSHNHNKDNSSYIYCERDADFILINIFVDKISNTEIQLSNSRIRQYCAPCLYSTMCRAITSMTNGDKLNHGQVWDGLNENAQIILEERISFFEHCIEKSAKVLENKYVYEGDAILKQLKEQFETYMKQ